MSITTMLALITSGIAMLMDIREARVENAWLMLMLLLGFAGRILEEGIAMMPSFLGGLLFPFIMLVLLFVLRMLGAGDIKLFCVLGSMLGTRRILRCMIAAFMIGGLISILILTISGVMRERMQYLRQYCLDLLYTRELKPYFHKGMSVENFHFTVPVFLSVVLYAGGVI